ncbi:MAG: hypothetical protein OXE95_10330 [Chloroflexi bacterium]|nr:hypothetical protein [Chloroflexota bacterium]MCY4247956.1 hypothetical protein [Chloroflexota bacterium]
MPTSLFYPKAAALSYRLSRKNLKRPAGLLAIITLAGLGWLARDWAGAAPVAEQPLALAQQFVQTQKPLVCVHTLLENEVETAKILRSLAMTRELGAATIVQFFPWAYVEWREGEYDWARTDSIVRLARLQGLRVIARLGLAPDWARPAGATLTNLPNAAFAGFAEYAAAFATRYAKDIQRIIVWNEPNLSAEWGFQPVEPARYARLLAASYPRIKQANPAAVVLAGALVPTLEKPGSRVGLNELDFLTALYELGAGAHYDALAAHTYGFRDAPETPPQPRRLNFRRVELLRQIMVDNGDSHKPIIITESGWNDHARWLHAVHPSQRAAYTLRAFQYAEAHWDWLEALCIWALRYPVDLRGYPDGYTLINAEFLPKPVYFELQAYARGWAVNETLWLPPPVET